MQLKRLLANKERLWVLLFSLFVSVFFLGYNSFNFPYFENDEGTYLSQAWSFLSEGKLAPYTYFYDHAPLGWIFTSLWLKITGGVFSFGFSLNSGRLFMILLNLFSSFFIFKIVEKISRNYWTALVAVLFFNLSPLAVYYHRRLLLDNIMVFWVLFSFFVILRNEIHLKHVFLSAVLFALGVLSKESGIFLLVPMLYIVYQQAPLVHKRFATIGWLSIVFLVVSLYPLYALLNGEFFPSGILPGDNEPHVSLVETWQYQISRDGGGSVLTPTSAFRLSLNDWLEKDGFIVWGGAIATLAVFFIGIRRRYFRYLFFLTLGYFLFLARGGIVLSFYVIPILPFVSMNLSLFINDFIKKILFSCGNNKGRIIVFAVFLPCFFFLSLYYLTKTDIYVLNQTMKQKKAVQYVIENISDDSIILIDNYAYLDLRNKIEGSVYLQKNAYYYWKADKDPEIKMNILKNDWKSIDYILSTPQLYFDAYNSGLELVQQAFENSEVIKSFSGSGYDIEIRKVVK